MVLEILPLLEILYGFYNSVFQPILAQGPYLALGLFSAALALIFSLIYAKMLDKEKANEIKEKLSDKQEKMKEARKDGDEEEASERMQETMKLNQELMKLNLRPMVGTMIFVALIFPWLSATFAPTIELTQTGDNSFAGNLTYAGEQQALTVDNSSELQIVSGDQELTLGDELEAFGVGWEVSRFHDHTGTFFSGPRGPVLNVNAAFIDLPFTLPYIGGALNWLGYYIVIAMPLTFIFRKMLGVA